MIRRQLTDDETDGAKECVNQIQAPFDRVLKDRRHFSNQPIECPIGRSTQTGSFGADA
jgi:hypothetical protein